MNQTYRSSDKPNSVTDNLSRAGDTVVKSAEEAARAAKDKASEISSQVNTGMEAISDAASQQIKTFASELERMGKNNPLGMIAGAVIVGVVIGLLGRGRA
jgi:ElaB/YqjD/DUF883 family membrane-anchored ribosome-binding protein